MLFCAMLFFSMTLPLAIFADTGVAMLCVINTLKLLKANNS